MKKPVDIVGLRFGRLTVVKITDKRTSQGPKWLCTCDCGGAATVTGGNLKNGHTKSCGCHKREAVTKAKLSHGHATRSGGTSKTYKSWQWMWSRCRNPNNNRYHLYGGRGVSVCRRWERFENFLSDMGERPIGLTLDRENPFKGYSPSNCRWASYKEQRNNTRAAYLRRLSKSTT